MIIIKKSIKEHDEKFKPLCKGLDDLNYVVGLGARTFSFATTDNNPEFTLANLQEIFYEHASTAKGELYSRTLRACAENINIDYLGWNEGNTFQSEEIIKHRAGDYWGRVEQLIDVRTARFYEHVPALHSYFYDGIIWRFCWIILNDTKRSGIVLDGSAWD